MRRLTRKLIFIFCRTVFTILDILLPSSNEERYLLSLPVLIYRSSFDDCYTKEGNSSQDIFYVSLWNMK